MLLLSLGLHAAQAQTCNGSWTCTQVFDGTSSTDFAVGSSIRFVPSVDNVFIGVERADSTTNTANHTLYHQRISCGGSTCSPSSFISLVDLGVSIGADQYIQASATYIDAGSIQRLFYAARTGPSGSCADDELDLSEKQLDYDSSSIDVTRTIQALSTCYDHGFSYSTQVGGNHTTTHTVKNVAGTVQDTFIATRSGSTWSNTLGSGEYDLNDHAQVIMLSGSDAVVVYHLMPTTGNAHRIRVMFPGNSPVELASSSSMVNYPAVAHTNGNILRVFFINAGAGKIQERTCDLDLQDCLDAGDWGGPNDSITGLSTGNDDNEWLEVREAPNGRQFLIWDQDSGANGQVVQFSERCNNDTWASPITVQTPSGTLDAQTLLSGNPNIAIDATDQMVGLAWAATDTNDRANITDGDVWWARKNYGSCP